MEYGHEFTDVCCGFQCRGVQVCHREAGQGSRRLLRHLVRTLQGHCADSVKVRFTSLSTGASRAQHLSTSLFVRWKLLQTKKERTETKALPLAGGIILIANVFRACVCRLSEEAAVKDKLHFVKFDVDEIPELAQELGIRAMPTFLFFKGGNKADEMVGANPAVLIQKAQNFAS